jgi:hypothetical protein
MLIKSVEENVIFSRIAMRGKITNSDTRKNKSNQTNRNTSSMGEGHTISREEI